MKQEEPTQEQIKEFWEWCGFKLITEVWEQIKVLNWSLDRASELPEMVIISPDDSFIKELPSFDLNNLFKYAVPKAIDKIMLPQEQGCSCEIAYAIIFKKWLQYLELDIPNHVTTLFWAIWEVIEK